MTGNQGSASVLLGDGTGGFSVSTLAIASDEGANDFGIGDFNGDSKTDLVVRYRLMTGDGMGGFSASNSFPAGVTGYSQIRSTDFDGDGKPDIAVYTPDEVQQSANIEIFLGDGAGGLTFESTLGAGRYRIHDLVIADVNGDGRPDILLPNSVYGSVSIFLNNGVGSVDADGPVITVTGETSDATGPAGAEVPYELSAWDNSGKIAALNCDIPSGSVFPVGTTSVTCTASDFCGNSRSRSFNVTVVDHPPALSLPSNIVATTTDSSGRVVTFSATADDVVSGQLPVSCTPNSGSTFPVGNTTVTCSATDGNAHTSTGTFIVSVLLGPTPTFEAARNLAMPGEVEQVAIGDFNHDVKPDMATAGSTGTYVLLGDGAGNFGVPMLVNATPSGVITTGDFNGDGNLDLVNGSAQVFLGNGTGGFSAGSTLGTSHTRGLGVGDFNRDNKLDLVIPENDFYSLRIIILLGDGAGGFSSQTTVSGNKGIGGDGFATGSVAIGDFDGDGNSDIALSCFDFYAGGYYVNIFLNDGSISFPSDYIFESAQDVVAGDFNRDGKLDLAGPWQGYLSTRGRPAFAILGDGTGAFGGTNQPTQWGPWINDFADSGLARQIYQENSPSFFPRVGSIADFNFDGIPDLATSGGDGYYYGVDKGSVLLGDGIGGFVTSTNFNVGSTAVSTGITVADFNLDGKPDIVISNWQNGSVSVFINSTTLLATAVTQTGSNVVVQTIGAGITFSSVSSSGTTSVTAIDPATAGDVPGGFAVADLAFEVTSTATFSGNVTSCFNVSTVNNEVDFNNLRVLHLEGSALVDRTTSHDFANQKICATTTSFSPFYLTTLGKKVQSLFDRTKAFKSGSTVPVKVKVLNETNQNISAATLPLSVRGLRRIGAATASIVNDAGNSNPDYVFRYDSGLQGYIYNLKTTGLAGGKYVLSFYAGSDRTFFYTVTFDIR